MYDVVCGFENIEYDRKMEQKSKKKKKERKKENFVN